MISDSLASASVKSSSPSATNIGDKTLHVKSPSGDKPKISQSVNGNSSKSSPPQLRRSTRERVAPKRLGFD